MNKHLRIFVGVTICKDTFFSKLEALAKKM